MSVDVVLLPGFGGSADQPVLVALEALLPTAKFACRRLSAPRGKLTPELEAQTGWLAGELGRSTKAKHVAIGRSFGGRLCVRVAAQVPLAAVVLLGFPVRPPGKKRPVDEAALRAMTCPTLILQGSADELGPLRVLRPIVKANPLLELEVLPGAAHSWAAAEQRAALACAAAWLEKKLS